MSNEFKSHPRELCNNIHLVTSPGNNIKSIIYRILKKGSIRFGNFKNQKLRVIILFYLCLFQLNQIKYINTSCVRLIIWQRGGMLRK